MGALKLRACRAISFLEIPLIISKGRAPALGDIRSLGAGDTVWAQSDARERKDWPRYVDAIAAAVSRGADVRWVAES